MSEFLASTKVPTLAPSRTTVPGRSPERDADLDHGVLAYLDSRLDHHGAGRDERHPGQGQPLDQPFARHRLHLHQIYARVDAVRAGGVIRRVRGDRVTALAQHLYGAGQVALPVPVSNRVERLGQLPPVEGVGPEVDLADREHLRGHAV